MSLTRRTLLLSAPFLLCSARGADAVQPLVPLEVWRTGNTLLCPPALVDGQVGFAGDTTAGIVDPDHRRPVWERAHGLAGPATFRPRLAPGRMIVGGREGVVCLDPRDGAELWRHAARVQTGVPTLGEDMVVFGDGAEIVALDLATGAERWRFATTPDTLASYAPCLQGDRVFVGPGDGVLYCLDRQSGALIWAQEHRALWQYLRQIHAVPGVLVAGSYKEQLLGISPEDGTVLWQFVAGNFINSHHLSGDLACLWSPTGWVYALDIGTGAVRWRRQTTDYQTGGGDWASLMAEITSRSDLLYLLDMADTLRLLDQSTGQVRATGQVPGQVRHAVLPIDAGRVVFPMRDGSLLMTREPQAKG